MWIGTACGPRRVQILNVVFLDLDNGEGEKPYHKKCTKEVQGEGDDIDAE